MWRLHKCLSLIDVFTSAKDLKPNNSQTSKSRINFKATDKMVQTTKSTNIPKKEHNKSSQHISIEHSSASAHDDKDNRDKELPSKTPKESLVTVPRQTEVAPDGKIIETLLVFLSIAATVVTFPFCLIYTLVVVEHFQRAIIMRNGKVYKQRAFGPGLVCHLPCVDVITLVDLRTICYDVPPQEALTKDSLTISVDAVVFYKIEDSVAATVNVTDYRSSTQFLAATTLRNALGTRKLTDMLVNRAAVSKQIFDLMRQVTKEWGILVQRVEIKDISLPLQLQKAMAAEAETTRLANAKIIVAKAEIESTRNLQKATDMLMVNPYCMQLRYLQSLQTIAGEHTHTVVFPFCADALRRIFS